jgi:hypothetical protein
MKILLLVAVGIAGAYSASAAASRFEEFTKKFAHTPDRAEIVSSTFLGGSGTEWLTGGGVQPDGTIVVAGVSLGPELDLGVKAAVLGEDAAMQPLARTPMRGRNGRIAMDKNGQPKYETLSWAHPNATAFIARLSPDLKEIKSVTRFGWKLGGLTDAAVANDGHVFLCGPATPGITNISSDSMEFIGDQTNAVRGGPSAVYVAKLSPDTTKVLWVRVINGMSAAPKLRLGAGKIYLQAADVRVFDASGKQLSQTKLPNGGSGHIAVNPIDGTIAIGGEHHWPTGREPYRDPTLNIRKPDGTLLYELYNWDGPLVGLNALRLVSDSAIRGAIYDSEGNLLIHAWSDGGNSVMYREPTDVFTASKKMAGLGLSIWGAGVLSSAYVIRIDTKTYNVSAGTLWVGYLQDRNKPNSVTISSFGVARDGSVCVAGSSAFGLIQTGNAFPGEPTGNYVAVMSRDLTLLRFCSTLPGAGQTEISDEEKWGVASGTANGKTLALFFSGTSGETPLHNARQQKFGGGYMDGHLLVLDLSAHASK